MSLWQRCWLRADAAQLRPASPAAAVALNPGSAGSAPATAAAPAGASFAQVLERELATFQATTGVYVKHLTTGEEAGVRADQAFNSFSVIKLAIMVKAYQMADRNELDLDQRIEVRRRDLRDGSGMLFMFDPGLRVTLRDLITQMIITSDNTATDLLLARVGGLEALNGWLRDAGFTQTRMLQSIVDFFRQVLVGRDKKYASLTNEQVNAYLTYPTLVSDRWRDFYASERARLQKEAPQAEVLAAIGPL